jgi:hypothetical protein
LDKVVDTVTIQEVLVAGHMVAQVPMDLTKEEEVEASLVYSKEIHSAEENLCSSLVQAVVEATTLVDKVEPTQAVLDKDPVSVVAEEPKLLVVPQLLMELKAHSLLVETVILEELRHLTTMLLLEVELVTSEVKAVKTMEEAEVEVQVSANNLVLLHAP